LFVWFDSASNQNETTLNIRPEIASEIVTQSEPGLVPVEQEEEPIENAASAAEEPIEEVAVVDGLPESAPAINLVEDEFETQSELPAIAQTDPVEVDSQPDIGSFEEPVSQNPVQENTSIVQSDNTEAPTVVDLTNREIDTSVVDAAQLTAEEEDTIAVQEALGLIAENRVTEAYAHLEQHIIDNRFAHQSRETYAKLLMSQGELQAAFNLVESGLSLTANHSGYKKIKARLLMNDGQIDAAVQLLLSRAPDITVDPEYHDLLATSQLLARDFEGASLSYRSLVQFDQSEGKYWYGFAASEDSLGNESTAVQAYSQAMQLSNLSANLRRRSQERLAVLSQ